MIRQDQVTEIMALFLNEYRGQFTINETRITLWMAMLGEFEENIVRAAALHVISEGTGFPPPVGAVRRACVDLRDGELDALRAPEAWILVLGELQSPEGKVSNLPELAREALKSVGTLYDLGKSVNIGMDRAQFIKAYTALMERRQRERSMIPAVKFLNQANKTNLLENTREDRDQLSENYRTEREEKGPSWTPGKDAVLTKKMDPEELGDLLGNTIDMLSDTPDWNKPKNEG
jgi:hypothetical protein